MKPEDVFRFYREVFVPAYSDLVTITDEKNEQVITEIENAFSHIAQYYNPEISEEDRAKNAEKAYNHLVRATLDCYKLICVRLKKEIRKYLNNSKLRVEIGEMYSSFLDAFREAREIEIENIGSNPLASLERYRDVALAGREILTTIRKITGLKPRVFVGYRYTEEDEKLARKFIKLLEYEGFECITGRTARAEDIDDKVKGMIEGADGIVIIFTKDEELKEGGWTTSTWLSDEKAHSLGAGKPVLLFFEKDISAEYKKGIHGSLEYIEFDRDALDEAILNAIPYIRDFYGKIIDSKGYGQSS